VKKFLSEPEEIIRRYERRKTLPENMYSPLIASTYMSEQEKERTLIKVIKKEGFEPLSDKRLLEVGCGSGINLLRFIQFGFQPSNLFANDIIPERLSEAKKRLPSQISFYEGDILNQEFDDEFFDIVFQSMVFSSILDYDFKQKLARKMWQWVKPGGGILWYDFIYDNPKNKDVKGVSLKEVKKLFQKNEIKFYRVTLAPPFSRFITKIHPILYTLFNSLYFLRTHVICFIRKPL
jgi:ubiquinone/menaquinone biosynthesis C-methylase UbiE